VSRTTELEPLVKAGTATGFSEAPTSKWRGAITSKTTNKFSPKIREDRQPAAQINETWAMDFVHD
jgi:hypothetical protein